MLGYMTCHSQITGCSDGIVLVRNGGLHVAPRILISATKILSASLNEGRGWDTRNAHSVETRGYAVFPGGQGGILDSLRTATIFTMLLCYASFVGATAD